MINKENHLIQITLKKSDYQKLKMINTHLNNEFLIQFTKSQTIQYLINAFDLTKPINAKPIKEIKPFKPTIEQNKKEISNAQFEKNINRASIPINSKTTRQTENGINLISNKEYLNQQKAQMSAKLHELKTRLQITIKEISEMLNINFETFKDYYKGKRYPTGNNLILIEKCLSKYGIK